MAYAMAALVTRLALAAMTSRVQLAGFSLAAALFEVAQIWIPGRSAGADNWVASTAGAAVGIGAGLIVLRRSRGRPGPA